MRPIAVESEGDGTIARVDIGEIVWQTVFPERADDSGLIPMLPEPVLVVGSESTWIEVSRVISEGGEVALGLGSSSSERGAFSLAFALDTDAREPTFIGESPFAERDTGQLRAFIDWSGNPLWNDPLALVTAWNIEADAPSSQYPQMGPISLSFDRFWSQVTGSDHPSPGTLEWWTNAPAMCRSTLDAPEGVLDGLPLGTVWVHVPDGWRDNLSDAVICLKAESLGSQGCGETTGTTSTWPYLYWDEVYMSPGEPVLVEVALLKDDSTSWVDRVVIGQIPFEMFAGSGAVMVELSPLASPQSYSEVTPGLAQARGLSETEDEDLLESVPPATEEPDLDPDSEP